MLPQIVIPGGRDSAEFFFSAVDDEVVDGDQEVQLQAQVAGADSPVPLAAATPATFIVVTDDDGPALRLVPGSTLAREGLSPAFTAVVSRNTGTGSPLPVTLASSDPTEATVPSGVVIPAGATSVTFPVNTVADGVPDGSQAVTLTAGASGHSTAATVITVTDAELPDLVVRDLEVPAGGLTRGLFTVRYRVTNQGFAPVSGKPLQRVILSPDPL
ncbi:MAG: hypothetical protein H7A46_08560 [Verrucomicrobiales bacterium]|nr:hypothetical protein [Verrucomicrobiales bacterium]